MKVFVATSLVAITLAGWPLQTVAQDYPNKPIRLVVPFPPGGGTDLAGRVAADYLTHKLGQSVVVENKPGAGSSIGIDVVAKSKPDGYALSWASSDGISMLPALNANLPYKIPGDFEFVAIVARTSGIAVGVNPKLPFKTMADLIAYAKANPGKLRYSTQGVGTSGHLAGALISKAAGIELVHIPYQGSAPAVTAAVSGVVDFVLAGTSSVKTFTKSGQLKALATFEIRRNPAAPDVPTLEESGMKGVSAVNYYGVLAPAGTPEPVLARLRTVIAEMVKDPQAVERFHSLAVDPTYFDGA
jgi:tripartite-type tricarboxylate transporter receptor subunit TctC